MEFLSLEPLIWLIAIALVAAGLFFSLVDRPLWLRSLAFACRALGIASLIFALCRPYLLSPVEDVHVVYLIDVSHSVDLSAVEEALSTVQTSIDQLEVDDSWSLFALGSSVSNIESTEALKTTLSQWQEGISDDRFRGETRLAEAMLETRLAFPTGKARRMVPVTDGQATSGDMAEAMRQLDEEQVDVRLMRVDSLATPEAGVMAITPSTSSAFEQELVRMQVRLAANQPISGTLRLIHNGVAVKQQEVQLAANQPNMASFDVEMNTPGASRWSAELVPAEDHFQINNQAACTVQVRGQPRVLMLHEDTRAVRSFVRSLSEQGVEIDVRGKLGLPNSIDEILAFDAVVISNLPATDMSPRQMEMLRQYVVDYGGGLVMLGSENSFGLGGYFKTPVEEVLPLVSRFEKEKEKPSLAMMLVIDKSGSMQGIPMALARQAAKAAVELLSMRDLVGVIGFDGQPQLICELRSAADVDSINDSIDSLQAGGGTYMYPAMVSARDMLETAPAKIRHMIVLSDGHTQPADHHSLAQEAADAGITVSTVALGGADRQLLASIAELGQGRYYETDDPSTVPQIFTKETMQATKSAIKEDLYGMVRVGDHPVLAGFPEDELPFVLGYVMTEVKPTAQLLLAAETGDPLLAVARYGLGTGMAYTSDLTERWGGEWLASESCGTFWAQLLRGVLRKNDTVGLVVHEDVRDGLWTVIIERHSPDEAPLSGIEWEAVSSDDFGKRTTIEVEEIGLGRYRAEVPLGDAKRLTLRLSDREFDKLKVLQWEESYPAEYALARDIPAPLANVPEFDAKAIRAEITPMQQRRSASNYAYYAAFVFLLLGIVFRRV